MNESTNTAEEIVSTSDNQKRFWIACISLAALLAGSWVDTKNEQEGFEQNQLRIQAGLDQLTATVTAMTTDHIRLGAEVEKNKEIADLKIDSILITVKDIQASLK